MVSFMKKMRAGLFAYRMFAEPTKSKNLSFAINYFNRNEVTFVIALETQKPFRGQYHMYVGHHSLKEYRQLVHLWSVAKQDYPDEFPIETFDSFMHYKEDRLPVVYGYVSNFENFPDDFKDQRSGIHDIGRVLQLEEPNCEEGEKNDEEPKRVMRL